MLRRLLLVSLVLSTFALVGCDGWIAVDIVNTTDQPLRVEVQSDDPLDVMLLETLPPGELIEYDQVLAGTSHDDFGQLRAFDMAGRLVFERHLVLRNSSEVCRIEIVESIVSNEEAKCDWQSLPTVGRSHYVASFVIHTDSTEPLSVYRRGQLMGAVAAGEDVRFQLSSEVGPATLRVDAPDGSVLYERFLYPTSAPGPHVILVP